MKRLLTVLSFLVLVPTVSFSQLVEVHIYHTNHSGATASQFRVEPLDYSTVHLGDSWSVPTAIGTSADGVALVYGACLDAPTYLGYAHFWVVSGPTCADFRVVADPASSSGEIEWVDCSGTVNYLYHGWNFRLDYDPCRVPEPVGTQPPDGAGAVSLNPTLVWTWDGNHECPGGIGMVLSSVYLGTSPDDLDFIGAPHPGGEGTYELTVGPLPPATTHYWRVKIRDEFWECPGLTEQWSPVYSFITEGTIPVEPTTWGRIKSLYR
jgi:hypothetical protein